MKNYYKILELDSDASSIEIRDAFRRLSKKYHPDLHQQDKDFEEYFKEIQEAYSVLKNDIKREEYNEQLLLFSIRNNRLRKAEYFIRTKLKYRKQKGQQKEDEERSYKPAFKPLPANYYRITLVLVFVLLAVAVVFFTENGSDSDMYQRSAFEYQVESENQKPEMPENLEMPENVTINKPKVMQSLVKSKPAVQTEPAKVKTQEIRFEDKPAQSRIAEKKDRPVAVISGFTKPELPETEKLPIAATVSEPVKKSTADLEKVYTSAEKEPGFTGGAPAFVKYLNNNLHYPSSARENGISGRVLVTFIVERNGKISNVSVVQGIGGGCDEEAVRVMKNAPDWIPGEEKGQKVRVQCTIPITFTLQ